ncbi:MAG: dephospho-CoA kinase [Bacteroidales bacterium]|jgi:dephospho-CoA kinase|nr:dephospho-CoA kinase [Bacteroidales bacterium]
MSQCSPPQKIALSGGIGSGKTCIAKVFTALGVPVYNSDEQAKKLMQTDEHIRTQLIELFGKDLYRNNELQKQTLAQHIFGNDELRRKVNTIVHPVVMENYSTWSEQQGLERRDGATTAYTIMETALVFENNLHTHFDAIIYVYAPPEIRIARVMQRNNCTQSDVEKRIKMQLSDTICMQKADYVIENNNFALSQIITIHQQLLCKNCTI